MSSLHENGVFKPLESSLSKNGFKHIEKSLSQSKDVTEDEELFKELRFTKISHTTLIFCRFIARNSIEGWEDLNDGEIKLKRYTEGLTNTRN